MPEKVYTKRLNMCPIMIIVFERVGSVGGPFGHIAKHNVWPVMCYMNTKMCSTGI